MSGDDAFAPAELREAVLDRATLERLFADLAGCAQVVAVLARGDDGTRVVDLDEARGRLLAGTAARVQIRYRFAGEEWWDTLLAARDGVRLVRICHGAAP